MLKVSNTIHVDTTLQDLEARKRSLADEIHMLQVNQTIVLIVITACKKNPKNEDLYKQFQEGYLTEREFVEELKDISNALRYQLSLAFLDAHTIAGA